MGWNHTVPYTVPQREDGWWLFLFCYCWVLGKGRGWDLYYSLMDSWTRGFSLSMQRVSSRVVREDGGRCLWWLEEGGCVRVDRDLL